MKNFRKITLKNILIQEEDRKAQLEAEIARLQNLLNDPDTSEERKSVIRQLIAEKTEELNSISSAPAETEEETPAPAETPAETPAPAEPPGTGISTPFVDIDPEAIRRTLDPYLEPIKKYYDIAYKKAKEAEDWASERAKYVKQRLSDPSGGMANLTSDIASSMSPITTGVLAALEGPKQQGFYSDFMKKTQRELAATKIPPSPKANIGQPAGLKPRKYTKGFYG